MILTKEQQAEFLTSRGYTKEQQELLFLIESIYSDLGQLSNQLTPNIITIRKLHEETKELYYRTRTELKRSLPINSKPD